MDVAVDDCLCNLYEHVHLFSVTTIQPAEGKVLLTTGLHNSPVTIDGMLVVRNELPNGTNIYLRENPLSAARDMWYTDVTCTPFYQSC